MKHLQIALLLLFLSFGSKSIGQTIRLKTSSVSYIEKVEKKGWGEWSDFVKAELVVTIDAKKDRIVVNSPEIQVFTILSYGDKIETETSKIVLRSTLPNYIFTARSLLAKVIFTTYSSVFLFLLTISYFIRINCFPRRAWVSEKISTFFGYVVGA